MSIRRGLPPGMWDSCTVLCQHFHAERQAGPAQERVFGWMAVTVAVVDGGGGGCGVDELRESIGSRVEPQQQPALCSGVWRERATKSHYRDDEG